MRTCFVKLMLEGHVHLVLLGVSLASLMLTVQLGIYVVLTQVNRSERKLYHQFDIAS